MCIALHAKPSQTRNYEPSERHPPYGMIGITLPPDAGERAPP